ncbi:hypothetical protein [Faecalicatena orotica]|uniref:hypothetical protein n=1 Tax=Faecalicatena orotica TaxID=1544 RepID=UPI003217F2D0
MENRFFDIDNNVYLNGLYIAALLVNVTSTYKLEEINLKLFLMKNPSVLLNLCKYLDIPINRNIFEEFQYSNLQADMSKYLLKVQVSGLMETLNFLYSKGLIKLDYNKNMVSSTEKCQKLVNNEMPEKIRCIASKINELFTKRDMKSIKGTLFIEKGDIYE